MRFPKTSTALLVTGILATNTAMASDDLPPHARSATQMTQAANEFIATLDEDRRKNTLYPLEGDDRATWSNLPIIMVQPKGVLVGDLTDEQRAAAYQLLSASMSSQGYAKVTGIMRLDDLLYDIEMAEIEADPDSERNRQRRGFVPTRSSGNYALAIFGNPADGNWGWKLAGHHAAVNFTVAEDNVGFTPTLLGSAPRSMDAGPYAGWMALPHEGSRGIDFMLALTDLQRKKAILSDEVPNDIFEGPGRRASLQKFEGLKVEEMSVGQARVLRALVSEYVGNAGYDSAEAQLALIDRTGWDELWFSWRGPIDVNGQFYYRLHGPRLLIEYNRQNPNHDHMIVRDPENDYGEDWLALHYEEHHPTMEEAQRTMRERVSAGSVQ